jgi:geranylgeranyl pyrophosphate synthase
MGPEAFVEFAQANRGRLEGALLGALPRAELAGTADFNRAVHDAVFPGGKRLRAYLALAAARLCGSSSTQSLTLACAVELIHAASLAIDDLPSMDDADLRRGRPVLHLVYGEGMTILAALALLNEAYALLARAIEPSAPASRLEQLLTMACSSVGAAGMIAGQASELALSGRAGADAPVTHSKTIGLMRLAMTAGAVASDQPEADVAALALFGESLGRAYQIYDDIADVVGDRQSTGKTVGQDRRHSRPSFVGTPLVRDERIQQLRRHASDIVRAGEAGLDRLRSRPEAALLRSAAAFILAGFDNPRGELPGLPG